jgi:peptide/nickel transport system permease protein
VIAQKRISFVGSFWGIARGSPKLIIGIVIFILLAAISILEPLVNNYRLGGHFSTEIGIYDVLLPPSWDHPLGTDHFGRDLLGILFTGLRHSLMIGLIAGGLATAIAVSLAVIAGYKGGRLEALITTFTNSVLIIPSWPILAIIVLFVERIDLLFLSAVLAFFAWPWPCRQIMPQIASLKERPYVDLARVSGFGDLAIMFREILPNFLPYIVVGFSYGVTGAIIAETGLRLVGLGPGGLASLGMILNWALYSGTLAQGYYLIAISPIVLLVLVFISLNFINIGLDEVYNPRLKRITGL